MAAVRTGARKQFPRHRPPFSVRVSPRFRFQRRRNRQTYRERQRETRSGIDYALLGPSPSKRPAFLSARHADEALTAVSITWIVGLGFCAAVSLWRIIRFNRMIQQTLAAPQRLQTIAADLAKKLGLRRVPDLRLVDAIAIPMVWCVGARPIIALPARLSSELDEQQTSMVLAHELAHLKRRDHWVRGLELVISLIYWWNPLVWWARRKLHEFEELCCDAWVAWAFPDREKCYAEALFKAATLAPRAHRQAPALASPFLNRGVLKGRIEAVLEGGLPRQVSPRVALALAAVAIVLLPSVSPSVQAVAVRPPFASSTQNKPGRSEPTAAAQGKIVGRVTVSGTDEPVSGATVRFVLGKTTKGLSSYHDAITGKTDANGHYSIDVPFGSVSVGRFDAPPGYWSEGSAAVHLVTSPESPVVTKDFSVRRGTPLRLRATNSPPASASPASSASRRVRIPNHGQCPGATPTRLEWPESRCPVLPANSGSSWSSSGSQPVSGSRARNR